MDRIATSSEYLRDDADYDGKDVWNLWTGTLTRDVRPIPGKGTRDTDDDTYRRSWFETVLGVVVATNP